MADPQYMYQCQQSNCGYIYDPDKGNKKTRISAGTAFQGIPDDWNCPVCGASKKNFRPLSGPGSVIEDGI